MTNKIDMVVECFRKYMNLGVDFHEVHQPYSGYLTSREREKDDELEKQNKENKMRMKYGKKWREKVDKPQQSPLRPGEVRKWNSKTKKYESNLD